MITTLSIDARTGAYLQEFKSSTRADVERMAALSEAALPWLVGLGRIGRAQLLDALATGLEAEAEIIVQTADRETALGEERLRSELARAAYQLRFMGEVIREGSYLEVSIEHGTTTVLGPRPDIRRTAVPIGTVVVFGASNFPLAFGTPGGDTVSAIAAGCPVIMKAHSSHVATSILVHQVMQSVLDELGAPPGVFQLAIGRQAGSQLVTDARVAAVGFTGSVSGGRALFDLASNREVPIPFFGELGSVNAVVVTSLAAQQRGSEIGSAAAQSMTLGNGQFCTKPGVFIVPQGRGGDAFVEAMVSALERVPPAAMLNDGMRASFVEETDALVEARGIRPLARAIPDERGVGPVLVELKPTALETKSGRAALEEHFGPFGVVIRYSTLAEAERALQAMEPALTATIHSAGDTDPSLAPLARIVQERAGRIVFDGFPTGVAVAWGMHHGGQYPASTSMATSVGAGAVKRWLRPVMFQNAPESVLPDEVRDQPVHSIVRRMDGRLTEVIGS